jgi:hypothetical protein
VKDGVLFDQPRFLRRNSNEIQCNVTSACARIQPVLARLNACLAVYCFPMDQFLDRRPYVVVKVALFVVSELIIKLNVPL